MKPEQRDPALLWDILQAAKDIMDFVQGKTFHEFENQKILRFAVERQILVIGEAANKVSESFRNTHPDIPWKAMIAQRNIIAHEYGEILVERIWRVATERIPELYSQIRPFVTEIQDNR